MSDQPNTLFITLEKQLDDLMQLCSQLKQENYTLHKNKQSWEQERSHLIEKNQLVRIKVESMISRLQDLEQSR